MKKVTWTILFAALFAAFGTTAAYAQAPAAAATPTVVAVVDVAQLIKNHPDFINSQKALQEEVKKTEAVFQQRQQGIVAKQKALETSNFKPGTPEHQRQLDDIANDLADFEKDAKAQQRKFALQNSKIMYDVYQDIKANIGKFAAQHSIAQVTDYREFEPNPADPQTVAEDMDQKLVWFNPALNITKHIIAQIYTSRGLPMPALNTANAANTGAAGAANPNAPGAAPAAANPARAAAAPQVGVPR